MIAIVQVLVNSRNGVREAAAGITDGPLPVIVVDWGSDVTSASGAQLWIYSGCEMGDEKGCQSTMKETLSKGSFSVSCPYPPLLCPISASPLLC